MNKQEKELLKGSFINEAITVLKTNKGQLPKMEKASENDIILGKLTKLERGLFIVSTLAYLKYLKLKKEYKNIMIRAKSAPS